MSVFKNSMNLILTLGFLSGLSFGSYQFCNWYGCNNWLSFMRADLICNACTDANYHIKNYQTSIYGTQTDTYIFEDYSLGKKSPRTLKTKKT